MFKRTYKFPGLALCVESEEQISGNASFERFLTDEAEAHGHITVRRSPLPQLGEGKRNGRYRRMKHGGREYYYTAFFDPAEGGYRVMPALLAAIRRSFILITAAGFGIQ